MKWLYNLLNGRLLVNIPICLAFGFISIQWCCRIWNDFDIRYYRPLIPLFGIVVLYCYSTVEYAKVIWFLDYRQVLTLFLLAPLMTMFLKLIVKKDKAHREEQERNRQEKEGRDQQAPRGFSNDCRGKDYIPEPLKKYAGEIVERLLVTDIKEQSFALGVSGAWGVGKTSFLDVLKEEIGDRAEVVEFNPWMCSSPEQVTRDFFASLRHQLAPNHSTLSQSIKEYAKYVNNVTFVHSALSAEMMLPIKQESLFERKKALSQKFARLPRPVVVIIDDIDRLERDEVFEVLRLIRNTADLSNVIYLVAYDKEYVTCVLEETNIKDSSAYLEKIFPVEVHLPKVEDHMVWKTLKAEIAAQNPMEVEFPNELFKRFDANDKELILKILDTYRRAKRFARIYMLNVSYVYQQARGELKWLDMFWLELLQLYDKKTYDTLSEDPGLLLFRNEERFFIRDGITCPVTQKDKNKYEGKPFWKEESPNILEKLFGRYVKTNRLSICFAENYDKFFTMSVSRFRLSVQEANQLFADGINADEQVAKWVDEGKYFSSITYQLKQINVNKLNDDNLGKYVCGILGYCLKVAPYRHNYSWEVKKILWADRYSKDAEKKAHGFVLKWFEENTKNDKELRYLSLELNHLYTSRVINPEGIEESVHPLVISNQEIETLLMQVMSSFLSYHNELTALDLMKENGQLSVIFKNCCVTVRESFLGGVDSEYKQVAFDTIIEHFSQKNQKPTVAEYNDAMSNLFRVETPVFDNPFDEDQYWDYASDAYDNKMQEFFGSTYNRKEGNKLEEFRARCFVVKEEDRN